MTSKENQTFSWLHLGLSQQIFIGAALGIFTGLFFGDECKLLLPLANGYSMLLQVAVYPYLISTLLANLGRLSPQLSWNLFKKGWLIYVFLIILCFIVLYLLTQAFPVVDTSLQMTSPMANITAQSLLSLLIPDNLFFALANNYVPAVILFCVLFGLMLQRVKSEHNLFKIFDVISEACTEFWRWLIKLAPIGIFLFLAYTVGTVRLAQLSTVIEYLLLTILGVCLLAFWLLPAIISAFTDIRYLTLMKMFKNVLLITFATKLSILALPYIEDITQQLLTKEKINHKNSQEIIKTILLIGFPLAQLGNFFVYLFIYFASTYYNQPLSHTQTFLLPFATFFSTIGSPETTDNAINFLASWLHLPNDIGNLFDSLGLLTEYGAALTSVMGFAFLTILIMFAYYGKLRWQFRKIFTHVIIVLIGLIGLAIFLQRAISNPGILLYKKISDFTINPELLKEVPFTMQSALAESKSIPKPNTEDSLTRIQKTGVIRVGYNADARPMVFLNDHGQLVGYDVDMMFNLARTLKSKIEFIPFTWPNLINDMLANKFDIAISGLYVTTDRLQYMSFSQPYLHLPLALVVPKNRQAYFTNLTAIRRIKNLRLAISNGPESIELAHRYFPNAEYITLDNFTTMLADAFAKKEIDAALWDITGGQMWTLGHPLYVTVAPNGVDALLLMGYMVQKNSPQLLNFLNYWLELKENDGTKKELFNKWITGKSIETEGPRWSILRNLLNHPR